MFTRKTLEGLEAFFSLHDFLKIGPYYWNETEPGIRVHSSWPAWMLIILMASWTSFRIGWAPVNFWYAGAAVYHYNVFRRMHQIQEFVNCMLNFNRQTAESVFGRTHPVKTDGCEKFLWMMIYNSFTSPALVAIALYGRDPLNSRYMYHFFSDRKEKKWLYWTMMVVEYLNEMMFLQPWLLIFFLLWVHTKSTAFWLQQMRFGANRRLGERPKDVIKIFQQLNILSVQFNDCFANISMPAFVLQHVAAHASLIYVVLKYHDEFPAAITGMHTFWAVIWFVLEGFLYTMLGNVNYYSRNFVKSWTDVLGVKSRKMLKSVPPLGVKIGSIYTIHRTTVLSIFLVVINLTVQALLLH